MKKEPSRRQRCLPYIRGLADRLALRDWRIDVDDEPSASGDCIARVNLADARWVSVEFSESFFGQSREAQRHSVVHELVHCHIAPYVKAVEKRTENDEVLRMLMEYGVDSIADALAPLVPLPPKL